MGGIIRGKGIPHKEGGQNILNASKERGAKFPKLVEMGRRKFLNFLIFYGVSISNLL